MAMIFNNHAPSEPSQTPADRIQAMLTAVSQMERECAELFYRQYMQEMSQALDQLKALKATLQSAHAKRESLEQAETDRRLKMKARLEQRNR
jgi:hypothetical protein